MAPAIAGPCASAGISTKRKPAANDGAAKRHRAIAIENIGMRIGYFRWLFLPVGRFERRKVVSPELRDHGRPQAPDFGGLFIDGGLHHDQLGRRINEDALPEVPQERELPSAAGKQVDLIAVPEPSLG